MKELTLLYTDIERIGYGRLGVKLAEALTADGYDVYERQGRDFEKGNPFDGRRERVKTTNVLCTISFPSTLNGWYDGQHKVCFTMFEATRLPEGFVECLHEYETIIVPSDQNVELFGAFHDNVHKVPLGVDTEQWKFVKRTPPGVFFNFLIGGSGPRKGVDLAVKAFELAFPTEPKDGPIPQLITKSPKPHNFGGNRVKQINGHLSPEDEIALYAQAHCYLQPSRGEGFGLQPLQAICQGIPTILTDGHGHKDFVEYGWGIPWKFEKTAYFSEGDAGEWWEPDLDCLVDLMRGTYDRYDLAVAEAEYHSAKARAIFTWKNTARWFVKAVGEDNFAVPYAGSGDWHEITKRLFRARTLVDARIVENVTPTEFKAGQDLWVSANTKRTLFEMGILDPECLTAHEAGLMPDMVDEYTQRHNYCPRCGVKSGTGVTKEQEIYAQMLVDSDEMAGAV